MAKRKIFSLVLAVAMVFTLSIGTFAADSQANSRVMDSNSTAGENTPSATPNDMSAFMGGSNVEVVDEFTITPYPEMNVADLVESSSLERPSARSAFAGNVKKGKEVTMPQRHSVARGATEYWQGTLPAQDYYISIPVTLSPAQIVNASLQCPKNESLNYDLYIFEVDASGNFGNIVSYSETETYFNTYPDGSIKTVDEGVAFVNTSTTTKNYKVVVWATQGGSDTDPFILSIGLDDAGKYDLAEPSDSPFYAYGVTEGIISGGTLHVENDQDWFVWNAGSEFKTAKIYADANYQTEVYTASGNKLILSDKDSTGAYPITAGSNYIRVFAKPAGFVPNNYILTITPTKVTTGTIKVRFNGDEGPDSYPDYPEGKNIYRFKNKLSPKVQITTPEGYPVPDCSVQLYWQSGSWTEGSGNKSRTVYATTDSVGEATLVLEQPTLPTALGKLSCIVGKPVAFKHYYDLDGIAISSQSTDEVFTSLVYHFSHSSYLGG